MRQPATLKNCHSGQYYYYTNWSAKWQHQIMFYPNRGLRSRPPRLGNRRAQSIVTAFYPNPGLVGRDWEMRKRTDHKQTNGGGDLRFGPAPIRWIVFNKMDSKIGFEMSLIVVEAIHGRCGSFMILTATISEIFGGLIYFSSIDWKELYYCWPIRLLGTIQREWT